MYILHSIDSGHSQLYREVNAMCQDTSVIKSMWCLVNLDYCNVYETDVDRVLESGMYLSASIPHYYWRVENALPLNEDNREYSLIILVNKDDGLMIARYGAFDPEYEPDKVWHWNSSKPWWSLCEVMKEDRLLANYLAPLFS